MRYVQLAATAWVAMALSACNPTTDTATVPVPSRTPSPITPDAPSAPVVPPEPLPPAPTGSHVEGPQQTLYFVGPKDLTIRLSTEDNFATAVMMDNSDRALEMHSVPSASGMRLEDGEGAVIQFKNGEGYVEFSPGQRITIETFRQLP